MVLIAWILAVYGAAIILVFGMITKPLRTDLQMLGTGQFKAPVWIQKIALFISNILNCMLCTSFWLGAFLSLLGVSVFNNFIIDGLVAAGAVQLIINLSHSKGD